MSFPIFVGQSTKSGALFENIHSLLKPSGLAVGDIMLFCYQAFDATFHSMILPSGWTQLFSTTSSQKSYGFYYKIATQTDVNATQFTFQTSASVDFFAGSITVYRDFGVGNFSNFQVVPYSGTFTTSGTSVPFSVTPQITNSLLITVALIFDTTNTAGIVTCQGANSVPSITLIERVDDGFYFPGSKDSMSNFVYSGEYTGLSTITSCSFQVSEILFDSNNPQVVGVFVLDGKEDIKNNSIFAFGGM